MLYEYEIEKPENGCLWVLRKYVNMQVCKYDVVNKTEST